MSRPEHSPDCAASRDVEPAPRGFVPKCTCWQWRKKRRAAIAARQESRNPIAFHEGLAALGNGNYYRPPLGSGEYGG